MPRIKFVCSDRPKLKQGEIRNKPGICFKNGIRAGFAAGIQKGQKVATELGVKRARIIKEIPQAALQMKAKRGVRRAREETARRTAQLAQIAENAMMAANDVNIERPRVKPAGRRQKFRAHYGLDVARTIAPVALPPTQVPIAIPNAPVVINIKDEINRIKGNRTNRTDVLAEIVQREFPELGNQTTIKKLKKRGMIERLVATGRYVAGGETMR